MRRLEIMTIVACCVAVSAMAQEQEKEIQPGSAIEAPPNEQPPIEISVPTSSNTSTGPLASEAETNALPLPRDPFWPVGYSLITKTNSASPASGEMIAPEERIEPPQWNLALKSLTIKGIMKSGTGYIAVINGQVTSENDTVSAVFKNRNYSWRVVKIGKDGVRFERLELAE